MTAAERKQDLRRRAVSLPKMEAQMLLEQFAEWPEVAQSSVVMVYFGVGHEPDTTALIRLLLERGQQVALPVCLPHRQMEARLISGTDKMAVNRYGIPEPDHFCPVIPKEQIGAVLVPCLLCDRMGHRLGHGGGYYDRWLADYQGFTAIVCPKTHLVDALPHEDHDLPVQLVLTDE